MEKVTDIKERISQVCDRHRDELISLVSVLLEVERESSDDSDRNEEAQNTRNRLEQIKAKDFISANEAAELLGCSAQHLRNLIQRAIDGKTANPIPFRDLDGPKVFPLCELMEWSVSPKARRKKTARRRTPPKTVSQDNDCDRFNEQISS